MQTITEQLKDLDNREYDKGFNLELHNEGEWGNTVSEYSAFNDAGVECEVGEFLYAFMRLIKPRKVLETGTHWGISASYMGFGLKHNGFGKLVTLEFLPEIHAVAKKRFERLGLNDYIKSELGDVNKIEGFVDDFDFMFLDTEPQTRFGELVRFYPSLKPGGYVLIHDLHRHMHQIPNAEHGFAWPYGIIPDELALLVRSKKIVPFHFSTPRGLSMFYKPKKEDYKW